MVTIWAERDKMWLLLVAIMIIWKLAFDIETNILGNAANKTSPFTLFDFFFVEMENMGEWPRQIHLWQIKKERMRANIDLPMVLQRVRQAAISAKLQNHTIQFEIHFIFSHEILQDWWSMCTARKREGESTGWTAAVSSSSISYKQWHIINKMDVNILSPS